MQVRLITSPRHGALIAAPESPLVELFPAAVKKPTAVIHPQTAETETRLRQNLFKTFSVLVRFTAQILNMNS